jgi:hypothetical protein
MIKKIEAEELSLPGLFSATMRVQKVDLSYLYRTLPLAD